jgi:hypothetical protein
MKNVYSASSLSSLNGSYDYYSNNHNSHNGSMSSRRAMAPIRELDFESRIMLNSKLPKKKPISDQIRKNDYIIDLKDYKYFDSNDSNSNERRVSSLGCNHNNQQLIKSFKNCFNNIEDDDSTDTNLNNYINHNSNNSDDNLLKINNNNNNNINSSINNYYMEEADSDRVQFDSTIDNNITNKAIASPSSSQKTNSNIVNNSMNESINYAYIDGKLRQTNINNDALNANKRSSDSRVNFYSNKSESDTNNIMMNQISNNNDDIDSFRYLNNDRINKNRPILSIKNSNSIDQQKDLLNETNDIKESLLGSFE